MRVRKLGRAKGGWSTFPELDPDAEVTWNQINAKVDEILVAERPRRHTFSGAAVEDKERETVTILPHGARQIKVHFPE